MMQDRYLLRKTGSGMPHAPANLSLQELEDDLPFDWANP
jgi:hypothetical protein